MPTLLVVDDDPGVRELLAAWLQGEGYRCLQAAGADEALCRLEEQPADVALFDLSMPGHDGLWLARELRERDRELALIMVTGSQRFDAAVEGMRLGVMDYLLKPFSRRQLLQSVGRAVESRERLRQQGTAGLPLTDEIAGRSRTLKARFASLESASVTTLRVLIETLHQRNPEAAAHARRVAKMAVTLGDALGLGEPLRTHVERGGLLHDIGKIAMPDALIHKAGPLAAEEIATIRTHVQVGYEILRTVPGLEEPAEIVLSSHEFWDGTGYPRRLAGGAIPVGGRIIAVVDTFDALTYGRVYRAPVPFEAAVAELTRCAGTQFDPDVIRAWVDIAEAYRPAEVEDRSA